MRALNCTRNLSLVLILAFIIAGCTPTRIERYYTIEGAPESSVTGLTAKLLYFKQSQRHFYATVRYVNTGTVSLTAIRSGPDAATITLQTGSLKQVADGPTRATWTPWTGTVEQTEVKAARVELAPGESRDITLRWEFPTTIGSYTYTWTMTTHGIRQGDALVPDIIINSPPQE